jgi:DNA-binding beta-propeller fold protein YncE
MFTPGAERDAAKITVGVKPNGLAFDPTRGVLIAANVGDPAIAGSFTLSVVDVGRKERIAEIPVPGRTRWTVYDPVRDMFYVNIASPAKIVAVDARNPRTVRSEFDIAAAGPHGLDIDPTSGRLFCACDAGVLFAIDAASGRALGEVGLSGAPDVIFLHPTTGRLYVAIGDPGVIDVIDTTQMRRVQTLDTEAGAHTLALDRKRGKVFAFLPETHRAAVYRDQG